MKIFASIETVFTPPLSILFLVILVLLLMLFSRWLEKREEPKRRERILADERSRSGQTYAAFVRHWQMMCGGHPQNASTPNFCFLVYESMTPRVYGYHCAQQALKATSLPEPVDSGELIIREYQNRDLLIGTALYVYVTSKRHPKHLLWVVAEDLGGQKKARINYHPNYPYGDIQAAAIAEQFIRQGWKAEVVSNPGQPCLQPMRAALS